MLNGILSVVAIILSLFIIVICIMSLVYSVRDSQKAQINMAQTLKVNKNDLSIFARLAEILNFGLF